MTCPSDVPGVRLIVGADNLKFGQSFVETGPLRVPILVSDRKWILLMAGGIVRLDFPRKPLLIIPPVRLRQSKVSSLRSGF